MSHVLYQRLYNDESLHYGSAAHDQCPGVRYLPLYEDWLVSPIIDLGCGRGDTVARLNSLGLLSGGVDFVDFGNDNEVRDITKPLDLSNFMTAICIDVLEHLYEDQIHSVLQNMNTAERQVITIHTGSSIAHGQELHVTRKGVAWWKNTIGRHLDIVQARKLSRDGDTAERWLFKTLSAGRNTESRRRD